MAVILTLHYKVLAILEVDSMNKQPINRTVGRIVVVLSFAALLAVLSGYAQPPQRDEGTAAHLFQVSIVGLVPMLAVFLMTADWKQPWRSLRPLALSSAALVVAFGALYYLEHCRTRNVKNAGLVIRLNPDLNGQFGTTTATFTIVV